jgi:hypothetical protein
LKYPYFSEIFFYYILGSHLGSETGYPDIDFFLIFLDPSRQMVGYCLELGYDHLPPHPLIILPFGELLTEMLNNTVLLRTTY